MRYGYFNDTQREYVIQRPDTPLPWINYLGSENYFGIISNTAGGYSFYKDARLRRLTRYRYNNAPMDSGGRYIYLRDKTPNLSGPRTWSPSWMPTRTPLDGYECRHGMGYTIITSEKDGIGSSTRYFVPLGETLEVWELTLTNHRDEPAELSIYSAVEFNLWDAMDDATNFQRNYSIGQVEVVDDVIYHKTEYRERRDHFAYFACSEPLNGFDTQRDAFLGPYRGWDSPRAVETGQMSGSIAHGWQPIGAQQIKIQLEVGEQKKIIFILGYYENPIDEKFDPPNSQIINKQYVLPVIQRYLQPEVVESAFQDLCDHWDGLLNKFQVTTPDEHTNRMVNIWNAYQVMITFNMSRSASYFESGIGRGMGFRDSNQDLLGFVHLIPERARERILDLAATQLPDGGAYHQYQPLTKRGNNDVGSNFNDDPLWLVLAVSAYLKETGDWSILNEAVPYDNQPGSEAPLYEHLQRSIQYTLDRLGPHALPLIGRADWNDCLNLNAFSDRPGQSFQTTTNKDGKVAESIFIAGLFVLAAKEMKTIADHIGDTNADMYTQVAWKMEEAVWEAGWLTSRRRARPVSATSFSSRPILARVSPVTVSAQLRPTQSCAPGDIGCAPACSTLVMTPLRSMTSAMSLDSETKVLASSRAQGDSAPRSGTSPVGRLKGQLPVQGARARRRGGACAEGLDSTRRPRPRSAGGRACHGLNRAVTPASAGPNSTAIATAAATP
jgi:cellobiose phosphorylase